MPTGDVEAGADAAAGEVVLGDRYELRRLLGTGGSGAVHLAHDRVLCRDVAVKLLRSPQDDVARARLEAEARHAAALAHPGVARLLDLGEDQGPTGPTPYLVMEYVEGRTLRELLRAGERLSVEQVLGLVAQIADAIAAVHAAGIVHRDLKPGNIMLDGNGRAVLLDFGIARHHDGEPLTMTGMIIGTVDYISPEQASGASASAASDVYALGMVAYECLTGILPLSRDTQVSTLMAHAGTAVPPVPPTVPPAVRELVSAMVALDPAQRPTSAAVAHRAQELLRAAPRLPVRAASERTSTRRRVGVLPEVIRGARRRHVVAAACALLIALTGAVALETKGDHASPAAADVSPVTTAPRTSTPKATPQKAAAKLTTTHSPASKSQTTATRSPVRPATPRRPSPSVRHAHNKHPKHVQKHGRPAHAGHGKGPGKHGKG